MTKVLVYNSTGAASMKGEMSEHGIIFLEDGSITSVSAEASRCKRVEIAKVHVPVAQEAVETTPVQSEKKKKDKNRG